MPTSLDLHRACRSERNQDGVHLHCEFETMHHLRVHHRLAHFCPPFHSGGDGSTYFAQLRLIFSFQDMHRRRWECALVRWLDTAPGNSTVNELRLRWAQLPWRQGGGWFDVISLSSIMRPVFLQPDPLVNGQFFFNDFVR